MKVRKGGGDVGKVMNVERELGMKEMGLEVRVGWEDVGL